eukprot:GEMP01108951.1.p1 GENE.GEMP01108951.1~~GEMP01108951.1.p1  ORF type:complete len:135 (-),score=3.27 GEMP01108951.1:253-657(-)
MRFLVNAVLHGMIPMSSSFHSYPRSTPVGREDSFFHARIAQILYYVRVVLGRNTNTVAHRTSWIMAAAISKKINTYVRDNLDIGRARAADTSLMHYIVFVVESFLKSWEWAMMRSIGVDTKSILLFIYVLSISF